MAAKRISFVFLALLICALYQAEAQTITAASCNASDVQAAFNKITSSTTTVIVPAGTCSWTAQVTLTVPSGNTDLTVQGSTTTNISCNSAGLCAGSASDGTTIIDSYASANSLFVVTTNSTTNALFRITGLTIEGGSGSTKYQGFIIMHGSSQNFRFDHNHLNSATYSPAATTAGMQIQGCIYGVADHNIIDQPSGSVNNGIQEYQGSCNGDSAGLGNGAWAQPTSLGTSESFYVENSIFNNGFGNDCLYGGRFVYRYNTFNGTGSGAAIQTHATGSTTDGRGCRSWEFYNNSVIAHSGNYINDLFFLDSGTGVVWGNTIPSSSAGGGTGYKNVIGADNDRTNNNDHTHTPCTSGTNCSNSFGFCGTSFNGTGSTWDQSSNTTTGYRCLDQPGAGKTDLLTGTFPMKCDQTTGCTKYNGTWPNQALEPIYEWADAYSQVPDNQSDIWATNYGPITQNQDFYLGTTNSGAPISFNGTSGVGAGTLASRPSTCTTGVAYWATNQGNWNQSGSGGQGELFVCGASGWGSTPYYVPYTYPHPLDTTNPTPAPPTLKSPSVAPQ